MYSVRAEKLCGQKETKVTAKWYKRHVAATRIQLREYRSSSVYKSQKCTQLNNIKPYARRVKFVTWEAQDYHSLKSVNLVRTSCQARRFLLLLIFAAWVLRTASLVLGGV